PAGEFHHVVKPGAAALAFLRLAVPGWHGEAGFGGQPLDRLGEAQPLLLDQEGELVAGDAAAEAVIAAAPVVGMEGWGFLAVERAAGPEIALGRIRFAPVPGDARPDHCGDRQAGADLVEEGRRKAHG